MRGHAHQARLARIHHVMRASLAPSRLTISAPVNYLAR